MRHDKSKIEEEAQDEGREDIVPETAAEAPQGHDQEEGSGGPSEGQEGLYAAPAHGEPTETSRSQIGIYRCPLAWAHPDPEAEPGAWRRAPFFGGPVELVGLVGSDEEAEEAMQTELQARPDLYQQVHLFTVEIKSSLHGRQVVQTARDEPMTAEQMQRSQQALELRRRVAGMQNARAAEAEEPRGGGA